MSKSFKTYKHKLRSNGLRSTGGKCYWCGESLSLEKTTIDHLYPRSFGGRRNASNTVASCRRCNGWRGNLSAFTFRRMIDEWKKTGVFPHAVRKSILKEISGDCLRPEAPAAQGVDPASIERFTRYIADRRRRP